MSRGERIEPHAISGRYYTTVEQARLGLCDEGFDFSPEQITRYLRYLRTMGLAEPPERFWHTWTWLGSVEEYELRRRAAGNGTLGWARDMEWSHPTRVLVREGALT